MLPRRGWHRGPTLSAEDQFWPSLWGGMFSINMPLLGVRPADSLTRFGGSVLGAGGQPACAREGPARADGWASFQLGKAPLTAAPHREGACPRPPPSSCVTLESHGFLFTGVLVGEPRLLHGAARHYAHGLGGLGIQTGRRGCWSLLHRAQDLNRRTPSLGPGAPRGLSPPASGDCCQPSAGVSPCWRAGAPHSMVASCVLERQEADLDPQ